LVHFAVTIVVCANPQRDVHGRACGGSARPRAARTGGGLR
jgi:hypothetical protein